MNRYTAETMMKEGTSYVMLSDTECDAVAAIIPEIGNNLFHFESEGCQVILPPSSLTAFKQDSFTCFKYGTPILFPPNRVKNGSFSFRERKYNLPLNEPPENHLHGEICSKAWEVVALGVDEQGAYLTSCFRYASHPEILEYFPHMLTFTVTYRLYNGRLHFMGEILNEGEDEAPFAYGLHPYFSVPFDSGEEIVLKVPASMEWPVTLEAFVTGRPSVTEFSRSLNDGVNIANYPKLGCSLLSLNEGERICRIEMRDRNYTLAYQIDSQFPYVVLFRPDWASAYSLEPYTYVTDAFNLPYEYELTGAKGILSGEKICVTTSLWTE